MENKELTSEWKLIPHSSQIADTGDYTGYYEITNGKASFESDLDDDEDLQMLIDFLNKNDYKLSTWRGKEDADYAWRQVSYLQQELAQSTAPLQARVRELERELERSDNYAFEQAESASELMEDKHKYDLLNKKLMGLLEEIIRINAEYLGEDKGEAWQSYRKDNGI